MAPLFLLKRRRSFLIANSRLFYPKHRWDGSSKSRKSRSRKPVRPVDPTNPDGPNPGTPGPLSIDYASSLDFGSNEISNKDQTYFARAQTYRNPDGSASELATANYVQVSDLRGTNAGWVLKVKQNGQFRNAETLHKELTGATVAFTEPSVRSNATDVLPPTATANIQLDAAGAETVVMQAPEKTGAGTWITLWGQAEKVTEKSTRTASKCHNHTGNLTNCSWENP